MAFTVELEEWVGSAWHRFITRRASPDFPEARVELESMQRPLSLLFRAMGDDAATQIVRRLAALKPVVEPDAVKKP